MELKNYQKQVIADLQQYLTCLDETESAEKAYNKFWEDKGCTVGMNGLPVYRNEIHHTPHICFKVPTGGGKTFLAAASIKPILDHMPYTKAKVVVWLVPSDAILEQTTKNLQNPNHPYHQKLAADFGGKLNIYTKQQILNAQNFNPSAVSDQLSIIILSYDSLRSKTKENRKLFQENGGLAQFPAYYRSPETLIEGVDETAAIQVINQLSPVVVVDESHHATTDLSVEMLKNLNPSFILDLTATPKTNSNIISYVDAAKLKREKMVKLPVIVYNRKSKEDVVYTAVDLRNKLEEFAIEEQKESGTYIRPIVLFQAEPKGNKDTTTFLDLKKKLVEAEIPEEEIAIKTAEINDIKNVDLLSPECTIRYIITVNALKEGWDCPFAYILATIANRTSRVDVEQIVGRILRQPYTRQHKNNFLNISYVFTSSNAFHETVNTVIKGLNNAGYSGRDYRIAGDAETPTGQIPISQYAPEEEEELVLHPIFYKRQENSSSISDTSESYHSNEETEKIPDSLKDILTPAGEQAKQYDSETNQESGTLLPADIREKMPKNIVYDKYREEIENLALPQFYKEQPKNIFTPETEVLLTKEVLSAGFTLKGKSTDINFSSVDTEIGKLDIDENDEARPKYLQLSEPDVQYFKQTFSEAPWEAKIRKAKTTLCRIINRENVIDHTDLSRYVLHVLENFTQDQLSDLQDNPKLYANKVKEHINTLLAEHRAAKFKEWQDSGKLICKETHYIPTELPIPNGVSTIGKSLFPTEGQMNDFEKKVISYVASLESVRWWHRNIEKRGFVLNGFINHYPDFIVKTNEGKIILIETKGDHLENADSARKAQLGTTWSQLSGSKYLYFLVYESVESKSAGIYSFDEFKDIMKTIQ